MTKKPPVVLAVDVFDHVGAAAYLKISKTYLYQLRHVGKAPESVKKGRQIFYTKAALDAWDRARKDRAAEREEKRNAKTRIKKAA